MRVERPLFPARRAFTLIEILVVLAIIALLSALLFPAFSRARESGRQATCQSNLQGIYFATQQYFQDERRYPDSLVDLLPGGARFDDGSASGATLPDSVNGYLKTSTSSLICPNDDLDQTVPRSSYGALAKNVGSAPAAMRGASADPNADAGRFVWNYWGYDSDGFAYPSSSDAAASTPSGSTLLLNPTDSSNAPLAYDARKNKIRASLSNRFAPSSTIITHCVWHRVPTAGDLSAPGELGYGGDSSSARDIVLRLDGSVKSVGVSAWKNAAPTQNKWQTQTP